MNLSIRCKVRSEYNLHEQHEYNFNLSSPLFSELIRFLKYSQMCNVFEMENVDKMIEKNEIVFTYPTVFEKYITLYAFPSTFEFYIYTDPVRDQVLQVSMEDSLRAIVKILNSTGDLFNDPKAEEWLDGMIVDEYNPEYLPIGNWEYPNLSFKYLLTAEFGAFIPQIIAESKTHGEIKC